MAEASIHIHIDTPVPLEAIDKIITAAVEAKELELTPTIPAGYRCAICFRSDGGHETSCTVNLPAGVS